MQFTKLRSVWCELQQLQKINSYVNQFLIRNNFAYFPKTSSSILVSMPSALVFTWQQHLLLCRQFLKLQYCSKCIDNYDVGRDLMHEVMTSICSIYSMKIHTNSKRNTRKNSDLQQQNLRKMLNVMMKEITQL